MHFLFERSVDFQLTSANHVKLLVPCRGSCVFRIKTGWGGKKMNRVAVRQFSFSSGQLLGLFIIKLNMNIWSDFSNLSRQFVSICHGTILMVFTLAPEKKTQTLRRFLYEMVTVLHSNVSSAMGWRHSWSFLATLVV